MAKRGRPRSKYAGKVPTRSGRVPLNRSYLRPLRYDITVPLPNREDSVNMFHLLFVISLYRLDVYLPAAYKKYVEYMDSVGAIPVALPTFSERIRGHGRTSEESLHDLMQAMGLESVTFNFRADHITEAGVHIEKLSPDGELGQKRKVVKQKKRKPRKKPGIMGPKPGPQNIKGLFD